MNKYRIDKLLIIRNENTITCIDHIYLGVNW